MKIKLTFYGIILYFYILKNLFAQNIKVFIKYYLLYKKLLKDDFTLLFTNKKEITTFPRNISDLYKGNNNNKYKIKYFFLFRNMVNFK